MRVRTLSVSALIAILFICLMGRLVYFSVAKNKTYEKKVLAQQELSEPDPSVQKGKISSTETETRWLPARSYTVWSWNRKISCVQSRLRKML